MQGNAERVGSPAKRSAAILKAQKIAQDRTRRLHNEYIAELEDEYRREMEAAAKIPAPKLQLIDGEEASL